MKRPLFVVAGSVSLALGIVGIFLPVLPTTPFLLLASACYLRGSKRMHAWLLAHPRLGPFIRAFEEGRGIPRRSRIIAIALLWISIAHATWMLGTPLAAVALITLATGVTIYLLRMPTLEVQARSNTEGAASTGTAPDEEGREESTTWNVPGRGKNGGVSARTV